MALIGNRSALNKSPGRFLSGTVVSGDRSTFNKAGMMRGAFERFSRLSAWPAGHLSPSAWMMPQQAGAMSSRNMAVASITATGSGAMGVNIDGAASVTFSAAAIGQLIASAVGAASFSITASGDIVATLGAAGAASFTIAAAGTAGALAWAQGQATMQVSAALVSYARGFMQGSTADQAALTADAISASVWASVAAGNNVPGSMGAKLNSAASGGVDYPAMADAVRLELQAELTRIIELAKIHGLVLGSDLIVSPATRIAGDISQTISESGGVTTVART